MIKLIDLIDLSGIKLHKYKIHCATGKINPPLESFFDGKFKEWQEHQNQKNFQCDEILSLIHLNRDKWLFGGIWKVLGFKPRKKMKKGKKKTWYQYSTKELDGLDHLTGRAIIQFDKNFRASYLKGENHIDKLVISEIQAQRMSVGDFPGYNSVLISYKILCTIVREDLPSWKSALSNVAGVYLITDNKTGKHYVGSAYGGEGIWQRWTLYSKNGHGGNKELKVILLSAGKDYTQYFQYSVLEVCDLNATKDCVIERETYWKNAIRSREFGYNIN